MPSAPAPPRSDLNFEPATVELGVTELLPLELDFTKYLTAGETITAISVTIISTLHNTSTPAMLSGVPTITGAIVQLWLDGGAATVGDVYRLEATITKSSGARMAGKLQIACSY